MSKKSKYSKNKLLNDIRDMKPEEIRKVLDEYKAEFFREQGLRGQGYGTGESGHDHYAKYGNLKRDIARIRTVMREQGIKEEDYKIPTENLRQNQEG